MAHLKLSMMMAGRATAVRSARLVAAPRLGAAWLSSSSHSDFETKRHPLPESAEGVRELIDSQVKSNKVMLYMKGTPAMPQCGFSQQVVRILHASGAEFSSVNVLEDDSIRDGVKTYSDWPTIPQLYVGGEFVGGCDIVTQAFQSGDLETMLQDAGSISKDD